MEPKGIENLQAELDFRYQLRTEKKVIMENIIDIIQKHSLTVRCLPHKVISHYNYREGDEEMVTKPSYDSNGKVRTNVKKSIVFSESWNRKMVREERGVEKGGWWYVKETKNIGGIVIFDRKYDKFFAPTLEEAIKLYLDSINCVNEILPIGDCFCGKQGAIVVFGETWCQKHHDEFSSSFEIRMDDGGKSACYNGRKITTFIEV